ncbi:MAG: tyrosine--tRNA ligase [Flavobacteriales bacterium]
MNLVEELRWRGLLQDSTPGIEEQLEKEMTSGYVGFDPTADSLHIGNLVPIILLVHLQKAGHKPYALVGGATGLVGDPSGKTAERQLLDTDIIDHNIKCQKAQLEQFLDFDCGENSAEMVNNYDWFKGIGFLEFIRDVGKHISVNYMMAKESVKQRIEKGISFTEFSYQLIQGYDFCWLNANKNVKLQMGGSDQWGNITTGTEMVRRINKGESYALTAPLVKKSDGTKFGKSEGGNVWLDPKKTSPYKFYQFWMNTSDEDAKTFISVFTFKAKDEIEQLISEHDQDPGRRILQTALAETITSYVHGKDELENAIKASSILFGKSTLEDLKSLNEQTFNEVFSGTVQAEVSASDFKDLGIISALAEKTGFLKSNGEARRALKENSVSVNRSKVKEDYVLSDKDLMNDKYVLLQRGKKNYFILKLVD